MAGERLLQVRLDEGWTAEGHAQSNEATLLRAQCSCIRQSSGNIPPTSLGGIQAQSGPSTVILSIKLPPGMIHHVAKLGNGQF